MKWVCRKFKIALLIVLALVVNCFVCTFANGVLDDNKIYEIKI